MRDHPELWQDVPWGEQDDERRRHWRRPWKAYATVMLGFIGAVMFAGSFLDPGWHTVGAVLVVLAPAPITLSDGPKRDRDHPDAAPLAVGREAAWCLLALAMVVGALLFA